MAFLEGLSFISSEMQVMALSTEVTLDQTTLDRVNEKATGKATRLLGLTLFRGKHPIRTLVGTPCPYPDISADRLDQLSPGSSLLHIDESVVGTSRMFFVTRLPAHHGRKQLLVGQVNPEYLWDLVMTAVPHMAELHVLSLSSMPLYSTTALPHITAKSLAEKMKSSSIGTLEWEEGGNDYLASYWSVFLRAEYGADELRIIVAQTSGNAFASVRRIGYILGLVLALSLFIALFLSSTQIRRNLEPLAHLQEGTQRIGKGDFAARVEIHSGDEFEELATSFNTMSIHLERNFTHLNDMGLMIRSILTSLNEERIIDTVLSNTKKVTSCDMVGFVLIDVNNGELPLLFLPDDSENEHILGMMKKRIVLEPGDFDRLRTIQETFVLEEKNGYREIISSMKDCSYFVLAPVNMRSKLSGVLVLGYAKPTEQIREDCIQVRQIADQVAIGLANTHLMDELSHLNWGTLTALARTVDAKSPWTAGHSERVTDLALQLGRTIGISDVELDLLQRAGLLHDIGKIGIANEILDSSSILTPEEQTIMRAHPEIGGRILEPIKAYRDVIPIVVQHHEWFNGTGYPQGLSGSQISMGARVIAVADVYDALIFDRPYRKGWDEQQVMSHICEKAGSQFDPDVVVALTKLRNNC